MTAMQIENKPDFILQLQESLSGDERIPHFDRVLQEVFIAAVDGFEDDDFSVLLNFIAKGANSMSDKIKLLSFTAPRERVPAATFKRFMFWFITNYKRYKQRKLCLSLKFSEAILQWIIGLLENGLVDPNVVDLFFFDYLMMMTFPDLVKYASKLLCRLTKQEDVTESILYEVAEGLRSCREDKYRYFAAVLSVFRNLKPGLATECELMPDVISVDINKVLATVPQKMDTVLKLVCRRRQHLEVRDMGAIALVPSQTLPNYSSSTGSFKPNSVVPCSTFNLEGLDKIAVFHPNSLKEASAMFKLVPIPERLLSLLRDEVGFFLILFKGTDIQQRFSVNLLQSLQSVLAYKESPATDEDKEYLLDRVYQLQNFMQQGIPAVSTFLSGYLLNWDGLDHRPLILNLIEWATFDSFQDLSRNILRPLYMLFVYYDAQMKQQIIQTVTNMIRNMFTANIGRVGKGLDHPFLNKAPEWTSDPEGIVSMMSSLTQWMERLIQLGMCLEHSHSSLLLKSIQYYEMINLMESHCHLPMWTVVSQGVIYRSLFDIAPVALNSVCRLLLQYHTVFLPMLRMKQPAFYEECGEKINLTSKYAQELINFLWLGKAFSRREGSVMFDGLSKNELLHYCSPQSDVDSAFDLCHNLSFLPFIAKERERHGPNLLNNKADYLTIIEFYLQDVADFIKHFSPNLMSPEITSSSTIC